MKWFSLDKQCNICKRQGPSVLEINHGDKKIYMCSLEWNQWLSDLLIDDPDGTINDFVVIPESCEDPANPALRAPESPSQ